MFTNKEQLCQSFWQLVKEQKFKAKKIEGGQFDTPLKASKVKDEPCIAFYSLSCIAINNRRQEKVPDDKFGDVYISCGRSEHCDWSTENMRQLDLCGFNLSAPI